MANSCIKRDDSVFFEQQKLASSNHVCYLSPTRLGPLRFIANSQTPQIWCTVGLKKGTVGLKKETGVLWDTIVRGVRVPLFSWFPRFWKFSCAEISAFSYIFGLILAFLPNFKLFFLVFCLWLLTPLNCPFCNYTLQICYIFLWEKPYGPKSYVCLKNAYNDDICLQFFRKRYCTVKLTWHIQVWLGEQ